MRGIEPLGFQGDERFVIKRQLGRGGMGIVYEAYDRERDETIALKTLHWAEPSAIYQFKQEFRALADVAHYNLVYLYELVAHDDLWFFTMELVKGVNFLERVREVSASSTNAILSVPRLRAALRQLAEGVGALHQAGKVHRDLKPSNVLVTELGRVVILDFGIVAEFESRAALETVEVGISGTVEYMSPEQCAGEPCGPASDWYAVGVLLYEALTGELPFTGSPMSVLVRKQQTDPPAPDEVASGLPADLVALCLALMARNPADRPSEAEVLRRLGASRPAAVIDAQTLRRDEVQPVGRATHLATLEDAFGTAAAGRGVSVCVHGPSGIGKTTLVRHFTDSLVQSERAVVLASRCYVRESVPYKALDGVIDMLSRLLKSMPRKEYEARLPRDIAALARVFPVLKRVEAIEERAAVWQDIPDRRELRRRAFAALRDLLGSIADERPVVIHIDDLQWADREGAELLDELVRSAKRLRLLFILSFRSEDLDAVPFLRSWLTGANTLTRRALEVGPLSTSDTEDFARQMLEARLPDVGAFARTLARESDGNPFLMDQIVRFAIETVGYEGDGRIGLGEMLTARLGQMPEGAVQLVDVLAVAGQPIAAKVACRAAGLTGNERPLVKSMRIAHLLRASSTGERIELYHDRIREHYVRELTAPDTRTIHRRLAESLEADGIDDPEALHEHWLGAGETGRAATYAAKAAAVAQAALAFDRAARSYRRALQLADAETETGSWYVGLGDALASAGRGGESAKAYLQAVATADDREALELERRAAEQLLISGRTDEGLEMIRRVLAKVGLKLAPSPRRTLLSLILRRLRLRLRGLDFHERSEDQIPAKDLTRIDVCWAVAEGMGLVDNIQGAAFQTLHLLFALDAGEPKRIARALAIEAGFLSSVGSAAEATRLLGEAEQLARRVGSEDALGLCTLIGALTATHAGRWERAVELVQDAEAMLSNQRSFVGWQLDLAKVYHIHTLTMWGRVAELCRLSERFVREALDCGNLFVATMFRTSWSSLVWLSADDIAGARNALKEAVDALPKGAFHIPHYNCMVARGLIDLYAGEGERALRDITEVWPRLKKSQLLRILSVRAHSIDLRARCVLAAASTGGSQKAALRTVARYARRIERERPPHLRVTATLLRAGIEATRGNRRATLRYLNAGIEGFKTCRMALWYAAATRRKGELLGGPEGEALIAEADAWMTSQGITNVERMTAMMAPGFPPSAKLDGDQRAG